MIETWRLFVAITLPAPVLDSLAETQRTLRSATPHGVVRWVDPASIHLTLKFLGDVPIAQRSTLETALALSAQQHAPFELSLADLGCFPNVRRPRVVWAGLAGALAALRALRDGIESAIAPLGYPTEGRPFSPHLTLGRVRREAPAPQASALGAQVARMRPATQPQWTISSVSLIRSDLLPAGAVYTELQRAPLRSAGPPSGAHAESC